MSIATFEGTVESGRIQLRDQVVLPEHTRVIVLVPELPSDAPPRLRSPRLVHPEQIADFTKTIVEPSSEATVSLATILIPKA